MSPIHKNPAQLTLKSRLFTIVHNADLGIGSSFGGLDP
jgi:hypothetical protein